MSSFPILSLVTFLPIISGVILFFINSRNNKNYYNFAILVGIVNFVLSLKLLRLDLNSDDFQLVEKFSFLSGYDIKYALGIDGISSLMIILTTFLVPICLFVSVDAIKERVKEYVIAFLMLEGFVIGSFSAIDLLLFYIFFEAMLIPMFLIIGIWGGKDRIYAAYKFFLYTLFGSVFFLAAIIYIYLRTGTTDLIVLKQMLPNLTFVEQKWLWLAFFVSFAIKIPMFPVHTWLPDAHVQAPTAGSIILAGILIKLGAYGLLRFSLPFFPLACQYFAGSVFILSVIAIIYASLVALMQEDMKKMIAYSSVAHMGFVTIGIFSFTIQGLDGAIMQMISHGLVSAALFLAVGVIYNRLHTKLIADFGGVAITMPNFAFLTMIFVLGSVGLPGTSGFVGEFLSIIGVFQVNKIIAILAAIGVILGACYMLWLVKRVFFGEIINEPVKHLKDLNVIEFISLATMAALVIILGIFPNLILVYLNSPVAKIVNLYHG
jgi:NADH-quinone oxidoreductase subunit M